MATVEVEKQTTVSECPVPERAEPATTVSGVPIAPLYTGEDLARLGIAESVGIGRPGQYPFTRGIHKAMYRDRLWNRRWPSDRPRRDTSAANAAGRRATLE